MKIAALIIILSCAGLLASAGEATSPAGSHGSHPGDPGLMDAPAVEDWLAWAATGNAAAGEAEFEFCRGVIVMAGPAGPTAATRASPDSTRR
jgi:hypothetical protein